MKKTISKKIKQNSTPNAVVVQPVHLPAVTEQPIPAVSWPRVMLAAFLFILDVLIWSYVFFRIFEIYNNYYLHKPIRVELIQPRRKQNVVAIVGNEEISLDDVKAFVAEIPQLSEVPFEQVYPNILEMMVNDKVVAKGAARYGIQKDPQTIFYSKDSYLLLK